MEEEVGESLIQLGSSDGSSNSSSSDPVTRVRRLLFRRMLVGIKDGRFFLGTFHCIDKQGNIILQDSIEYRSTRRSSPSPMEQRCLGLILIPSSCRTSCHVDCSVEEQLSLLKFIGPWVWSQSVDSLGGGRCHESSKKSVGFGNEPSLKIGWFSGFAFFEKAVAKFWLHFVDTRIFSTQCKFLKSKGNAKEKAKTELILELKQLEEFLGDKMYFGGNEVQTRSFQLLKLP
ncbi:hypothetical protein REPUB_Repub14bG0095100 [Reevesia pubescens]